MHRDLVFVAIAVLLSVPFLFYEFAPDQPQINKTVAVTIFLAVLWMTEAVPVAVTALMPLVLLPAFQILTADRVSEVYFNDTMYVFLGSSMVAYAMEKWKLHARVTLHILVRVGTRPLFLMAGFTVTTFCISMFISNSATAAMVLPLLLSVLRSLPGVNRPVELESPAAAVAAAGAVATADAGPDPAVLSANNEHEASSLVEHAHLAESRRRFCSAMLLSIAYAASLGGTATLIGTGTNLAFVAIFRDTFPRAPELSFLAWTMYALPQAVVMMAAGFLVLYVLYARDAVRRGLVQIDAAALRQAYEQLPRITPEELVILVVAALLVLCWFTEELWSDALFNDYVEYGTVSMLFALVLLLTPCPSAVHRGRANTILQWTELRELPWGIVFLMGAGFAVAEAFRVSGLSAWVVVRLQLLSWLPVGLLVAGICFGITFLTELTSNIATANIVLPILAATAVALQQNPLLLMVPTVLSCSNAFMLPVATPPNAIVFSSGLLRIREMALAGVILNLVGVLVNTAWIFAFGRWTFGIRLKQLPEWAEEGT